MEHAQARFAWAEILLRLRAEQTLAWRRVDQGAQGVAPAGHRDGGADAAHRGCDAKRRLWRSKSGGYLFDHKALAIVFRAKMLEGIRQAGLKLPGCYPTEWVVDCKAVGSGQKALVYLGRYLYRGVLPEKNIVSDRDGEVTFRYQDSKTKKWETRTLSGVEFLRKILLHILPKGFMYRMYGMQRAQGCAGAVRRARNFGFLHPNSKLVKLVQLIKRVFVPPPQSRPVPCCPCCGNPLRIARTRVTHTQYSPPQATYKPEMIM